MNNQVIITSDEKGGKVYMIKNVTNDNKSLAFYEDETGNILNIKLISTEMKEGEVIVNIYKLNGTSYLSVGGNIKEDHFNVITYNQDIFVIPEETTRAHSVGCSAAITAAGIPWSIFWYG
ncbi:MAG: hypothetical protein LUF85_10945 [Bacteroides sp.]|nr:hypothetical protein [Bacteroides sp.]